MEHFIVFPGEKNPTEHFPDTEELEHLQRNQSVNKKQINETQTIYIMFNNKNITFRVNLKCNNNGNFVSKMWIKSVCIPRCAYIHTCVCSYAVIPLVSQ